MILETIIKAGAGAVAGAVVGWAATALTLTGRVDAVEKGLQRVESNLVTLIAITQQKAPK